MKKNDKMLIGIVIGIVLLIIVALMVTLAKPEPTYQSEETPEGVTHNYILAFQKEDFERAYGYLSPSLDGYPETLAEFEDDVHENPWRFRMDTNITISLGEVKTISSKTLVKVTESRFDGGGLFDSGQRTTDFDIELKLDNGAWKIIDSDYYFHYCWRDPSGYQCHD